MELPTTPGAEDLIMERHLWREDHPSQAPVWARLCCLLPFLAFFLCLLTTFPAHYPTALWARVMWQPASALAPRKDLDRSEDSRSLFTFQASPETDKKPSAGRTTCTSSPCGLPFSSCELTRSVAGGAKPAAPCAGTGQLHNPPAESPQQDLPPVSGLEVFLPPVSLQ